MHEGHYNIPVPLLAKRDLRESGPEKLPQRDSGGIIGPMRTYRLLRRLRPLVQAGALLLFLYLLLVTRRDSSPFLPVQLFFRLDPLVGLASMIAARAWIGPLALSLLILAVTLVLGRAWCGWLCPLGTVLDLFPLGKRGKRADPSPAARWRQVKHFILLALLFGALLGSLGLIFLDPITLL